MKLPSWEEMTAPNELAPRTWTCPQHDVEYGVGVPDTACVTWTCPQCEREAFSARQEFQRLHDRYHHWRTSCGVPTRYRCATADRIATTTPAGRALRAAVEGFCAAPRQRIADGIGMVLLGPPGIGKTLAGSALVNAACTAVHGPIYASWPDVLADVKAGFNGKRDDDRRTLIDRLIAAPLLVLDELGVKAATEFEHAELFRLVDRRYQDQRATIAIGNATKDSFAQLIGERIADRLGECGPLIALTGTSQRGKIACVGDDAFPLPPPALTIREHTQGRWREHVVEDADTRRWAA